MMNFSIECDVTDCRYNQCTEHYCTLNKIKVTEDHKSGNGCADCASYKPRE